MNYAQQAKQNELSATVVRGSAGSHSAAAPLSLSDVHEFVYRTRSHGNAWMTVGVLNVKTKHDYY
jgi:hypothetical protein